MASNEGSRINAASVASTAIAAAQWAISQVLKDSPLPQHPHTGAAVSTLPRPLCNQEGWLAVWLSVDPKPSQWLPLGFGGLAAAPFPVTSSQAFNFNTIVAAIRFCLVVILSS